MGKPSIFAAAGMPMTSVSGASMHAVFAKLGSYYG